MVAAAQNDGAADDDAPDLGEEGVCCIGAAAMGRCTCWVPVFDHAQSAPVEPLAPPRPRALGCCGSCGVVDGLTERFAIDKAAAEGRAFYCHQGLRRVLELRHPDGRVRVAGAHDYEPAYAIMNGERVPLKADGTAADLCAAWARWARAAGHTWFERGESPPSRRTV